MCLASNNAFAIITCMNIFHKINELNVSKDAYGVVGGGILVALGLLEVALLHGSGYFGLGPVF